MSETLAIIFSLLVAAAGWYYLFHSRAAEQLGEIELKSANRQRVRLRRIGGVAMMLLAVAFFALFRQLEQPDPGRTAAVLLLAVLALLGVVLVLGLVDVRLTWQMRRSRER